MKRILLVVAASAAAFGCAPVGPMAPMAVNSPLRAPMFMQMSASSNLWEMQSSQLAHQMAQSPAVHSFASMIIADHGALTARMMATARSAGVPPPPPMMLPQERMMLDRLRATPRSTWDRAYRDMQVAAHLKAIALHRNYAASGDNPTLRAVAAQALPRLQHHLAMAQRL